MKNKNNYSSSTLSLGFLILAQSSFASIDCPESLPFYSEDCGQCFQNSEQAADAQCPIQAPSQFKTLPKRHFKSASCNLSSSSEKNFQYSSPNENSTTNGISSVLVDVDCMQQVGNGNDGCINTEGRFITREYAESDPDNTREALLDIEYNLGINLDDNFIAMSGYQGNVPAINPMISLVDAKKYLQAVIGKKDGTELADKLNTNGDAWLDRAEATAAKGEDPLQTLGIPSISRAGGGLAMDDILAYIGLYFGDGALDKYAGDLGDRIMCNLTKFTRTWQPGVNAADARYDTNGRYIGY